MNFRALVILMVITAFVSSLTVRSNAAPETKATGGNAERGRVVYQRHCMVCHGEEGKADTYHVLGTQPSNLSAPMVRNKADAELLTTIHEGKPNMPVWKRVLPESEILDVLAYVRTLAP